MTKIVNMHEAKTSLSKLVEEAERGEDILLARAGRVVARIVALRPGRTRELGQWKGKVRMAEDFDAPLEEEDLSLWEGR
ncbi:MAG: type II toxin-antitoxin system Phd/YefM family antitoxin [Sandaracinaceae bacterium]|nr:type II toxin-antitoxin system Phd/YefM family antitoxin [Sandaracinaceae bacterium]